MIDDMQEPFEWREEVAHLLDDVDELIPILLDSTLSEDLAYRLQLMLLNARDLKEASGEEWVH